MKTLNDIHDMMQGSIMPDFPEVQPCRLIEQFFESDPEVSDEVYYKAYEYYYVNADIIGGRWYV